MSGGIRRKVVVVIDKHLIVGIFHHPELLIQAPAHAKMDAAGATVVDNAIDGVVDGHIKLGRVANEKVERNARSGVGLVVGQPDLARVGGWRLEGRGSRNGGTKRTSKQKGEKRLMSTPPSTAERTFSDMPM